MHTRCSRARNARGWGPWFLNWSETMLQRRLVLNRSSLLRFSFAPLTVVTLLLLAAPPQLCELPGTGGTGGGGSGGGGSTSRCGDGRIDPARGEQCEGTNFGTYTCQ